MCCLPDRRKFLAAINRNSNIELPPLSMNIKQMVLPGESMRTMIDESGRLC
jgi:hypothetical protein